MKSSVYAPVAHGFSQRVAEVRYIERPPPQDLVDVVHVFWELRTLAPLPVDSPYHAVPDACVNRLFNQIDLEVAGVTALHTQANTLNLGTVFHCVGVRFFPGGRVTATRSRLATWAMPTGARCPWCTPTGNWRARRSKRWHRSWLTGCGGA